MAKRRADAGSPLQQLRRVARPGPVRPSRGPATTKPARGPS